jgi:tetratricopeptide (TPR) repeat protein
MMIGGRTVIAALAGAFALAGATLAQDVPPEGPASPPSSPAPTLSRAPDGGLRIENASLEDALRLAQGWIENGQTALAEQLLAQLAPIWPEEPRIPFLRGLAAKAEGDDRAAVRWFREALDLEPDADRARYELALAYHRLEDWDQAAFHYRFVLGSDAPDPVKVDVATRLIAISDQRRWTASFEAALAPSTNINVAPSDAVIDPIFGAENPATLTGDSTAQSGTGVHAAGALARQIPLAMFDGPRRRVRAQLGVAGALTDYDDNRFDDASASLLAGVTMRRGTGAWGGDVRAIRRWYGGDEYEDAVIGRVSHDRRIAAPLSLRLELSAADRDNLVRDDMDGLHTRGAGRLRLALSGASFLYAEASASRFDTDANATSFWDGGLTLGAYRDFRRGWSVDVAPGFTQREYDGPDPFFQTTREDTRWSLAASVLRRDIQVMGFAPFVRYRYTRNDSTLKLHEFEQHAAEFGFTGVF